MQAIALAAAALLLGRASAMIAPANSVQENATAFFSFPGVVKIEIFTKIPATVCTATLIAPTVLLTAPSCFPEAEEPLTPASNDEGSSGPLQMYPVVAGNGQVIGHTNFHYYIHNTGQEGYRLSVVNMTRLASSFRRNPSTGLQESVVPHYGIVTQDLEPPLGPAFSAGYGPNNLTVVNNDILPLGDGVLRAANVTFTGRGQAVRRIGGCSGVRIGGNLYTDRIARLRDSYVRMCGRFGDMGAPLLFDAGNSTLLVGGTLIDVDVYPCAANKATYNSVPFRQEWIKDKMQRLQSIVAFPPEACPGLFPAIKLVNLTSEADTKLLGDGIFGGQQALLTFTVGPPYPGPLFYDSTLTRFVVQATVISAATAFQSKTVTLPFVGGAGSDSFFPSKDAAGNAIFLPGVGGQETTFYRLVEFPRSEPAFAFDVNGVRLSLVIISGPGAGLSFSLPGSFNLSGFVRLRAQQTTYHSKVLKDVALSFTTSLPSSIALGTADAVRNFSVSSRGIYSPAWTRVKLFAAEVNAATGWPLLPVELTPSLFLFEFPVTITLPKTLPTPSLLNTGIADGSPTPYLICAAFVDYSLPMSPEMVEEVDLAEGRLYERGYHCVPTLLSNGSLLTTVSPFTNLSVVSAVAGSGLRAGSEAVFTWSLTKVLPSVVLSQSGINVTVTAAALRCAETAAFGLPDITSLSAGFNVSFKALPSVLSEVASLQSQVAAVNGSAASALSVQAAATKQAFENFSKTIHKPVVEALTSWSGNITLVNRSLEAVCGVNGLVGNGNSASLKSYFAYFNRASTPTSGMKIPTATDFQTAASSLHTTVVARGTAATDTAHNSDVATMITLLVNIYDDLKGLPNFRTAGLRLQSAFDSISELRKANLTASLFQSLSAITRLLPGGLAVPPSLGTSLSSLQTLTRALSVELTGLNFSRASASVVPARPPDSAVDALKRLQALYDSLPCLRKAVNGLAAIDKVVGGVPASLKSLEDVERRLNGSLGPALAALNTSFALLSRISSVGLSALEKDMMLRQGQVPGLSELLDPQAFTIAASGASAALSSETVTAISAAMSAALALDAALQSVQVDAVLMSSLLDVQSKLDLLLPRLKAAVGSSPTADPDLKPYNFDGSVTTAHAGTLLLYQRGTCTDTPNSYCNSPTDCPTTGGTSNNCDLTMKGVSRCWISGAVCTTDFECTLGISVSNDMCLTNAVKMSQLRDALYAFGDGSGGSGGPGKPASITPSTVASVADPAFQEHQLDIDNSRSPCGNADTQTVARTLPAVTAARVKLEGLQPERYVRLAEQASSLADLTSLLLVELKEVKSQMESGLSSSKQLVEQLGPLSSAVEGAVAAPPLLSFATGLVEDLAFSGFSSSSKARLLVVDRGAPSPRFVPVIENVALSDGTVKARIPAPALLPGSWTPRLEVILQVTAAENGFGHVTSTTRISPNAVLPLADRASVGTFWCRAYITRTRLSGFRFGSAYFKARIDPQINDQSGRAYCPLFEGLPAQLFLMVSAAKADGPIEGSGIFLANVSMIVRADVPMGPWTTVSALIPNDFGKSVLDEAAFGRKFYWRMVLRAQPSSDNGLETAAVIESDPLMDLVSLPATYNETRPVLYSVGSIPSTIVVRPRDFPPSAIVPGTTLSLPWQPVQEDSLATTLIPTDEYPFPVVVSVALGRRVQTGSVNSLASDPLIVLRDAVSSANGGLVNFTVPLAVPSGPWFLCLILALNRLSVSLALEPWVRPEGRPAIAIPIEVAALPSGNNTSFFPSISVLSISGLTGVTAGKPATLAFKVAPPLPGQSVYRALDTRFVVNVTVPAGFGRQRPTSVILPFVGGAVSDSFLASKDAAGNAIFLPGVGGQETTFYRLVEFPRSEPAFAFDVNGVRLSLVIVSGPGAGLSFSLPGSFNLSGFVRLRAQETADGSAANTSIALSFTTALPSSIALGTADAVRSFSVSSRGLYSPTATRVKLFAAEVNAATGWPLLPVELTRPLFLSEFPITITLPRTLPTPSLLNTGIADGSPTPYLICVAFAAAVADGAYSYDRSELFEGVDLTEGRLYERGYHCVPTLLSNGSLLTTVSPFTNLSVVSAVAGSGLRAGSEAVFTWSLTKVLPSVVLSQSGINVTVTAAALRCAETAAFGLPDITSLSAGFNVSFKALPSALSEVTSLQSQVAAVNGSAASPLSVQAAATKQAFENFSKTIYKPVVEALTSWSGNITLVNRSLEAICGVNGLGGNGNSASLKSDLAYFYRASTPTSGLKIPTATDFQTAASSLHTVVVARGTVATDSTHNNDVATMNTLLVNIYDDLKALPNFRTAGLRLQSAFDSMSELRKTNLTASLFQSLSVITRLLPDGLAVPPSLGTSLSSLQTLTRAFSVDLSALNFSRTSASVVPARPPESVADALKTLQALYDSLPCLRKAVDGLAAIDKAVGGVPASLKSLEDVERRLNGSLGPTLAALNSSFALLSRISSVGLSALEQEMLLRQGQVPGLSENLADPQRFTTAASGAPAALSSETVTAISAATSAALALDATLRSVQVDTVLISSLLDVQAKLESLLPRLKAAVGYSPAADPYLKPMNFDASVTTAHKGTLLLYQMGTCTDTPNSYCNSPADCPTTNGASNTCDLTMKGVSRCWISGAVCTHDFDCTLNNPASNDMCLTSAVKMSQLRDALYALGDGSAGAGKPASITPSTVAVVADSTFQRNQLDNFPSPCGNADTQTVARTLSDVNFARMSLEGLQPDRYVRLAEQASSLADLTSLSVELKEVKVQMESGLNLSKQLVEQLGPLSSVVQDLSAVPQSIVSPLRTFLESLEVPRVPSSFNYSRVRVFACSEGPIAMNDYCTILFQNLSGSDTSFIATVPLNVKISAFGITVFWLQVFAGDYVGTLTPLTAPVHVTAGLPADINWANPSLSPLAARPGDFVTLTFTVPANTNRPLIPRASMAELSIWPCSQTCCCTIGRVPFEDGTNTTVTARIPPDWPTEGLDSSTATKSFRLALRPEFAWRSLPFVENKYISPSFSLLPFAALRITAPSPSQNLLGGQPFTLSYVLQGNPPLQAYADSVASVVFKIAAQSITLRSDLKLGAGGGGTVEFTAPRVAASQNATLEVTVLSGNGAGTLAASVFLRLIPGFPPETDLWLPAGSTPGSLGVSASTSRTQLLQLILPNQQAVLTAGSDASFLWRSFGHDNTTQFSLSLTPFDSQQQPKLSRQVFIDSQLSAAANNGTSRLLRIPANATNGFSQLVLAWQGRSVNDGLVSISTVTVTGGLGGTPFLRLVQPSDPSAVFPPGSSISVSWDFGDGILPNAELTVALATSTGAQLPWTTTAGAKAFSIPVPFLFGLMSSSQAWTGFVALGISCADPDTPFARITSTFSPLQIRPPPRVAAVPRACQAAVDGCVTVGSGDAKASGLIKVSAGFEAVPPSVGVALALCRDTPSFPPSAASSASTLARAGLFSEESGLQRCLLVKQYGPRGGSDSANWTLLESFRIPSSTPLRSGYYVIASLLPPLGSASFVMVSAATLSASLVEEGKLDFLRARASALFSILSSDPSAASLSVTAPTSLVVLGAGDRISFSIAVAGLDPSSATVKIEILALPALTVAATISSAYAIQEGSCVAEFQACTLSILSLVRDIAPAAGSPDRTFSLLVTSLVAGGENVKASSVPFVVKAAIAPALLSVSTGNATAVLLGRSLTVAWTQSSSTRGPFSVSLVPINCAGAQPVVLASNLAGAPQSTSNSVTAVVPASYSLPESCAVSSSPTFVARVQAIDAENAAVSLEATSPGFLLLPASGVLRITTPTKGARMMSSSRFSVMWEYAGVEGSVALTFHVKSSLTDGPEGIVAQLPTAAMTAAVEARSMAASLTIPEGQKEVILIARLQRGSSAVYSYSAPFVLFAPSNQLLEVTVSKDRVAPGEEQLVSFSYQGFEATRRVVVAIANDPDSPRFEAILTPPEGIPISDRALRFRVPRNLASAGNSSRRDEFFIVIGIAGSSVCSQEAGTLVASSPFSVVEASANSVFLRELSDATKSDETAPAVTVSSTSGCSGLLVGPSALILLVGGRLRTTWAATNDLASSTFRAELRNRNDPSFVLVLRASLTSADRTVELDLPPSIDTSSARSSAYHLRLVATADDSVFADSLVFTLRPPAASISSVRLSTASDGSPFEAIDPASPLIARFSAAGFPASADEVTFVLRNRFLGSLSFTLDRGSSSAGVTGPRLTLPSAEDLQNAGVTSCLAASAFVVRVVSSAFSSISADSTPFTINGLCAADRQVCFTTVAEPSKCITASGWATITELTPFTFRWLGSGFAAADVVTVVLKNALVTSFSRPLCDLGETPVTWASGACTATALTDAATLVTVPGGRDAFVVEISIYRAGTRSAASASPLITRTSPLFSIRPPGAPPSLRIVSPTAFFSTTVGASVVVRYRSFGLRDSETLKLELVNVVLGPDATITVATGLAAAAEGETTVVIPEAVRRMAGASSSSSAANRAWRFRASSSAVFGISPAAFAILPPGLRIVRPDGATVRIGESLDIAFEAFGVVGAVSVTLLNEVSRDLITVAEILSLDLSSTTQTLSWAVPTGVSTKASIASAWYVRVASLADPTVSARSGGLTIGANDKKISVLSPAPLAEFFLGQPMSIAFAGNGLRGTIRSVLRNEATGQRLELPSVEASAANPAVTFSLPLSLSSQGSAASKWFLSSFTDATAADPVRVGPLTIKAVEPPVTVDLRLDGTLARAGSNLAVAFSLSSDAASSADVASGLSLTLRNRESSSVSRVLSSSLQASDAGMIKSFLLPSNLQVGGLIGSSYFVRVFSVSNAAVFGDSDTFSIVKRDATIIVTSGGLVGAAFAKGDSCRLEWDTVGIDEAATLRITLVNSKTGFRSQLAEVSANSKSAMLAFPSTLSLPAPEFRSLFAFELALTSDPTVTATSRGFFTILPPRRSLRVVNPSSAAGQPIFSPVSGTRILVEWLGRNVAGLQVKVMLRNAAIPSNRLSLIPADELEKIGTVMTVVASAAAADTTAGQQRCANERSAAASSLSEDAAAQLTCGSASVIVTPAIANALEAANAFGRENPFSFSISLLDDDLQAESAAFFFRRPVAGFVPPVVVSPAADDVFTSGDIIKVRWVNASVTGGAETSMVSLTVNCSLPGAETPLSLVASQTMTLSSANTAATSPAGIPIGIPPLAVAELPVMTGCVVAVSALSFFQSARFSVRRSPLSLVMSSPSPLVASSVELAAADPTRLSRLVTGEPVQISWAYRLNGSQISSSNPPAGLSFSSVRVQLQRIDAEASSPSSVFALAAASASTLISSIAAGQTIPSTLPFGTYFISVAALPSGWKEPVTAFSQPFVIVPADRSLKIEEVPTTIVVGKVLSIFFTPTAISASNNIRATVRPEGAAASSGAVLIERSPCTGLLKTVVPFTLASGRYIVRLTLVEDPELAVDTPVITITTPAKLITVKTPALGSNREIPTWTAGEVVPIAFEALNFPSSALFTVTLEQDRFLLGSADRTIAVIAENQALSVAAGGALNATIDWSVPSDLDSSILAYVKVVHVNAGTTDGKMAWARSSAVNLRSAPLPGLKEWISILCKQALPAANLSPLCLTTCSSCTAGQGSWMAPVTARLDFDFPWPGSAEGSETIKNALGALSSAGQNLCWPKAYLTSTTAVGAFSLRIDRLRSVNASIAELTANNVKAATLVLSVSGATSPISAPGKCDSIPPVVQGAGTVSGSIDAAIALISKTTGSSAADVTVTVKTGGKSSGGSGNGNSRRLAGSSSTVSFDYSLTTADDGSADSAAEQLSQLPGGTTATAYSSSSQSSVEASSSASQSLFPTLVDSGSANRPAGGDDAVGDTSETAFSSGEFAKQQQIALVRDISRATSGGGGGGGAGSTPSPAPPGPGANAADGGGASNLAAIIGGSVGGLVAATVIVGAALYVLKLRSRPWASVVPATASLRAISTKSPLRAAPSPLRPAPVEKQKEPPVALRTASSFERPPTDVAARQLQFAQARQMAMKTLRPKAAPQASLSKLPHVEVKVNPTATTKAARPGFLPDGDDEAHQEVPEELLPCSLVPSAPSLASSADAQYR